MHHALVPAVCRLSRCIRKNIQLDELHGDIFTSIYTVKARSVEQQSDTDNVIKKNKILEPAIFISSCTPVKLFYIYDIVFYCLVAIRVAQLITSLSCKFNGNRALYLNKMDVI